MSFSNAYVCVYYNMVIAYALYYLVLSFTSELPWQNCNPKWSSPSKKSHCIIDKRYVLFEDASFRKISFNILNPGIFFKL